MAVSSEFGKRFGARGSLGGKQSRPAKARMFDNFLNFRFEELSASKLETVTERCGGVDVVSLTKQAANYFRAIGKQFDFRQTGKVFQDVSSLLEMLRGNLGEFTGIDLVKVKDEGSQMPHDEFVIYREFDDFDTYKLFFMPIKVLSLVDVELREILTDFFTYLEIVSPFLLPDASYEMRYCLGLNDDADNIELEDFMGESKSDYALLADRYVNGDIARYFKEIRKRRIRYATMRGALVNKMRQGIRRYREKGIESYPITPYACKPTYLLLDFLEKGIELYNEDNLLDYELRFIRYRLGDESLLDDEVDAYEVMEFERQFLFTWEMDDEVMKTVIDVFNSSADASATILLQAVPLSSVKDRIEKSDYPMRWLEWYLDFLDCINE